MKNKKEVKKDKKVSGMQFLNKWSDPLLFTAVFIMLLIVLSPMAFEGLRPGGVDVLGSVGATHQMKEYKEIAKEDALWNKTVFSGMPFYHRRSGKAFSFDTIIHKWLGKILYRYIWLYLIGFIGMFYLLRFFKISWRTSAFCALGFILIPHYMSILSIGHFQKFRPVMYMPFVTFFFLSFMKKKNIIWLLGFIFSFSVQIRTHHYQVVFYQIILLFFVGLFYLISFIRNGEVNIALRKILLLIPACILVIAMVAQPVFVAGEYTPYSIRGGTGEEGSSGLDSSYATSWSMHPLAVFGWTMPRFFGGTSQEEYNGSAVPQLQGKTIPGYWGYMPFTQTYDYIGIILVFFAIVGVLSNWKKGIIKLLSGFFVLSLLLAFGRHFHSFYDIFFQYLPYFNKFRVPAMMQLMLFFLTIIFAGFGLESILKKEGNVQRSVIIAGVILLVSGLVPFLFGSSFDMTKAKEVSDYGVQTANLIAKARLDMMTSDGLRLILYAIASVVLCVLYLRNSLKKGLFLIIILAVSLSDQLPYMLKAEGDLHNPDVLEKRHFSMNKTDQMILRDDSYYRVFPITENPFNSNDYSYYHNSIGGYNAAKLRIYQDIIENCFYSGSDKVLPLNWNVMKMLNTKYIISSQQLPPNNMKLYYHDKSANLFTYQTTIGSKPAWFVNEYKVIEDRLQRFDEINAESFDAFETAILEEDPKIKISKPVEGNIQIIEESFNEISYKVTNDQPTLFVASEIFYPAGWKCYIDGNETEIFKTNHILRSVFIKDTGTHEIRFEFSPDTYNKNLTFSIIGHIIAWVALIVLAVLNFMNYRKRKQEVGI